MADDDPEDRAIIKDAMEEINAGDVIGYTENGEQAIEMLNQLFHTSSKPSLIVLDLNMPKMNGMQTLEILKKDERYKDIPVIIYSTSINSLDKEKSLSLGAHSYITKPVSFTDCMATAKTFLDLCTARRTAG